MKRGLRTWFLFGMMLLGSMINVLIAKAAPISFSDLLDRERSVATKKLAYGAGPDQFGELWMPDGPGPHQVVVLIHGGCWLEDLPGVELMAYMAEDLRRGGFAVWNLEYRRLSHPGAGYPGTFLDIANGMDYLRRIADADKLDLSHVIIIGHSAGGHLGLWAAARARIKPASPLYGDNPLAVKAVITLAGINDLAAYRDHGPSACGGPDTIDRLIDAQGRTGQDIYADTSPAALLPLGVEQVIVSGSLDPIVPAPFGSDYGAAAKTAGDRVTIQEIANAGHFDLIDPRSDAWKQIKGVLQSLK